MTQEEPKPVWQKPKRNASPSREVCNVKDASRGLNQKCLEMQVYAKVRINVQLVVIQELSPLEVLEIIGDENSDLIISYFRAIVNAD